MELLKILLVEDVASDAELALWALTRAGIDHVALRVDTEDEYIDALDNFGPDVILCDYSMPRFSGSKALSILTSRHEETPFIFLSGTITETEALSSLKAGATDYILKSAPARLAHAVERAITQSRKNSSPIAQVCAGNCLQDRRNFCDKVNRAFAELPQGAKLFVTKFDVERFHSFNDFLGTSAGDVVLQQVSWRLADRVGEQAACSIGSDIFAFYIISSSVEAAVEEIYGHIQAITSQPVLIGDREFYLSVKYGLTYYPENALDADALLKNAGVALKRAKDSGDRFVFYSPAMHEHATELFHVENKLRIAIRENQFSLHYQPKYDVTGTRMLGVEALLRWNSPELGRVAPSQFIPILEDTGLIIEVGEWVLYQAKRDWENLQAQGLSPPRIAVNISPVQLKNPLFLKNLLAGGTDWLDLEITESSLMTNVQNNSNLLRTLVNKGIAVEIDDFGTGYSSLSYIATLPINGVKIDRSFIVNMVEVDTAWKLVSAILAMAKSLELKVTAEGVETKRQVALLAELGCDVIQGYYFGRPMPVSNLAHELGVLQKKGMVSPNVATTTG